MNWLPPVRLRRRGSVAIFGAAGMLVLLAMADLATEYGYGLVIATRNQRTADAAAFAGAVAYGTTGSVAAMNSAANSLGALNGVAAAGVTTTLVASPTGDGNSAVHAIISTPFTLVFNNPFTATSHLDPAGGSYAEVVARAPPCILALSGTGSGVSLSGGTAINAPNCAVNSNASVTVPCGTNIHAPLVTWNTVAPRVGCDGIQPPPGKSAVAITQTKTPDPLAGNATVSAAVARIDLVDTQTIPSPPAVSGGTSLDFGFISATSIRTGNPCTATTQTAYAAVWTVACPPGGTYNFGSLTVEGGITVNFDTAARNSAYDFAGPIANNGSALTFGGGTFNLAAGLATGAGGVSFGSGTFNIAAVPGGCSDGGRYSICNTSTLSIAGPANLVLQSGLYTGGGARTSIGAGSGANSYQFGSASNGNAITLGGSGIVSLGDAAGGVFQLSGNLVTAGGACLTLPAAGEHDIYGSITTAGGLILGAGTYTVTGYVDIGGSNGGDVTCNGQSVGLLADNVTLVIGASTTPGDNCAAQAFCIAAGFGNVLLAAPAGGPTANLAVIGPISGGSAGAAFTEGAINTIISGVFYLPQGAVSLSGGASVGSGAGQCLELIGSQITLAGGTTLATACPGFTGAASSSGARLVQ